jgi:hypothetical protein
MALQRPEPGPEEVEVTIRHVAVLQGEVPPLLGATAIPHVPVTIDPSMRCSRT